MEETQINFNPPPPPISPAPPVSPAPARKKFLILKIGILTVILVVVGLTVVLATRVFDPLWNPFREEPEKVIEEMSGKMKEVKSANFEINTEIDMTDNTTNTAGRMSFNIKGDSDTGDPQNIKSSVSLNFSFTTGKLGESLLLDSEIKTIGKESYFKLNNLVLPSFFEFLPGIEDLNIGEFKGKWIKLDEDSLKKLGMQETQGLNPEEQQKLIEEFQKLFSEAKIYYVKKELPDEKINGKKMYHYLLVLDNEETAKLIGKMFETAIQQELGKNQTGFQGLGTDFMVGAIKNALNEFFDKVGEITFEFWIGKKDKLLYDAKINKEIDVSKFDIGTKGKVLIKAEVKYSKFNQPIAVEAPKEFKSLEEILIPFLMEAQKKAVGK